MIIMSDLGKDVSQFFEFIITWFFSFFLFLLLLINSKKRDTSFILTYNFFIYIIVIVPIISAWLWWALCLVLTIFIVCFFSFVFSYGFICHCWFVNVFNNLIEKQKTKKTSILHRISPFGLFYSKTKISYVFSFHSSFGVLIFTFDMRVWMTYLFCTIKNNGNNVRCTAEGEKSNKCARNHTYYVICQFKRNSSKISLSQLSVSSFVEKITKWRRNIR